MDDKKLDGTPYLDKNRLLTILESALSNCENVVQMNEPKMANIVIEQILTAIQEIDNNAYERLKKNHGLLSER